MFEGCWVKDSPQLSISDFESAKSPNLSDWQVPLKTFVMSEGACIYFLIHRGAVVYVGQSKTLPHRLYAHATSHIQFDEVKYCRVFVDDLDFMDAELICRLKPKYNVNIPSSRLTKLRASRAAYEKRRNAAFRRWRPGDVPPNPTLPPSPCRATLAACHSKKAWSITVAPSQKLRPHVPP